MAAPAQATLSVSSLSVTPSTTQAGGTTGQPGPDITIAAQFSTPNGDSPRDLTIALAPGLLANPTAVPLCPTASFNAGLCPASSQIGSGYITGTAPGFGLTLSLPTDAYLIQPTGSEVARMGLIVYFFGFPVVTQSAPISIRTTPNVGIDIPLTSIPNQLDGIGVIVNALKLTIDGTVNGKTFTRNPTSCSAATTTLTVDSYGAPSTSTTQQSSFTPTGCGTLPYTPKLSGIAAQDTGDDGAAFAATITADLQRGRQHAGSADPPGEPLAAVVAAGVRVHQRQPVAVPVGGKRHGGDTAAGGPARRQRSCSWLTPAAFRRWRS